MNEKRKNIIKYEIVGNYIIALTSYPKDPKRLQVYVDHVINKDTFLDEYNSNLGQSWQGQATEKDFELAIKWYREKEKEQEKEQEKGDDSKSSNSISSKSGGSSSKKHGFWWWLIHIVFFPVFLVIWIIKLLLKILGIWFFINLIFGIDKKDAK